MVSLGSMPNGASRGGWQGFVARLTSWQLVTLVGLLFVLDVFLPDPIPFVDEIFLGVLTLLLARWKQRRAKREREPSMKDVTPGRRRS